MIREIVLRTGSRPELVHALAFARDGRLFIAPLGTPPDAPVTRDWPSDSAAWLDTGLIGIEESSRTPFYQAAHDAWGESFGEP